MRGSYALGYKSLQCHTKAFGALSQTALLDIAVNLV